MTRALAAAACALNLWVYAGFVRYGHLPLGPTEPLPWGAIFTTCAGFAWAAWITAPEKRRP